MTSTSKAPVLVVLQLTGGNDYLNTVIPYTNPLYRDYRPVVPVEGVGIGDNCIEVIIASGELEYHQDRSFAGARHCEVLLRLGELIFARCHNPLQQFGHPGRGGLDVLRSVPAKIPAVFAKTDQPGTGSRGDLQRTEQVEAALHHLGGSLSPLGLE